MMTIRYARRDTTLLRRKRIIKKNIKKIIKKGELREDNFIYVTRVT